MFEGKMPKDVKVFWHFWLKEKVAYDKVEIYKNRKMGLKLWKIER